MLATALSGTQSNGTDRPDLIANPNLPAASAIPSAGSIPAPLRRLPFTTMPRGRYSIPGNEGRNVITGPGLAAWDTSLERQMRWNERFGIVFRSDFFNLTNHPNFDRPGVIYGTSNFGNISSAENSREIQFSVRLNW